MATSIGDIPRDILREIADRLEPPEIISMRSVDKNWREIIAKIDGGYWKKWIPDAEQSKILTEYDFWKSIRSGLFAHFTLLPLQDLVSFLNTDSLNFHQNYSRFDNSDHLKFGPLDVQISGNSHRLFWLPQVTVKARRLFSGYKVIWRINDIIIGKSTLFKNGGDPHNCHAELNYPLIPICRLAQAQITVEIVANSRQIKCPDKDILVSNGFYKATGDIRAYDNYSISWGTDTAMIFSDAPDTPLRVSPICSGMSLAQLYRIYQDHKSRHEKISRFFNITMRNYRTK